ncbi:unnamed protein product [Amoebophrya sp. A120]|nr:unnamed protein product [Amoebophrya sp. A120]|eukprot:GSA120T00015322001.1
MVSSSSRVELHLDASNSFTFGPANSSSQTSTPSRKRKGTRLPPVPSHYESPRNDASGTGIGSRSSKKSDGGEEDAESEDSEMAFTFGTAGPECGTKKALTPREPNFASKSLMETVLEHDSSCGGKRSSDPPAPLLMDSQAAAEREMNTVDSPTGGGGDPGLNDSYMQFGIGPNFLDAPLVNLNSYYEAAPALDVAQHTPEEVGSGCFGLDHFRDRVQYNYYATQLHPAGTPLSADLSFYPGGSTKLPAQLYSQYDAAAGYLEEDRQAVTYQHPPFPIDAYRYQQQPLQPADCYNSRVDVELGVHAPGKVPDSSAMISHDIGKLSTEELQRILRREQIAATRGHESAQHEASCGFSAAESDCFSGEAKEMAVVRPSLLSTGCVRKTSPPDISRWATCRRMRIICAQVWRYSFAPLNGVSACLTLAPWAVLTVPPRREMNQQKQEQPLFARTCAQGAARNRRDGAEPVAAGACPWSCGGLAPSRFHLPAGRLGVSRSPMAQRRGCLAVASTLPMAATLSLETRRCWKTRSIAFHIHRGALEIVGRRAILRSRPTSPAVLSSNDRNVARPSVQDR